MTLNVKNDGDSGLNNAVNVSEGFLDAAAVNSTQSFIAACLKDLRDMPETNDLYDVLVEWIVNATPPHKEDIAFLKQHRWLNEDGTFPRSDVVDLINLEHTLEAFSDQELTAQTL